MVGTDRSHHLQYPRSSSLFAMSDKDGTLWEYMKHFIDEVEQDTIQDLIGAEQISQNEMLTVEVHSLEEILAQLHVLDKAEKEENTSFREWHCDEFIREIKSTLTSLDDSRLLPILDSAHPSIASYFRDIVGNCEDEEEEVQCKIQARAEDDGYHLQIYRIRDQLTIFNIHNSTSEIKDAFRKEEADLNNQIEGLRNQIDAKSRRGLIDPPLRCHLLEFGRQLELELNKEVRIDFRYKTVIGSQSAHPSHLFFTLISSSTKRILVAISIII